MSRRKSNRHEPSCTGIDGDKRFRTAASIPRILRLQSPSASCESGLDNTGACVLVGDEELQYHLRSSCHWRKRHHRGKLYQLLGHNEKEGQLPRSPMRLRNQPPLGRGGVSRSVRGAVRILLLSSVSLLLNCSLNPNKRRLAGSGSRVFGSFQVSFRQRLVCTCSRAAAPACDSTRLLFGGDPAFCRHVLAERRPATVFSQSSRAGRPRESVCTRTWNSKLLVSRAYWDRF
jgi:hypothetical protein